MTTTYSLTGKKTVNYLNNRDILSEIHMSKSSYCSFISTEDHRYDIIIDKPELSLEEILQQLSDVNSTLHSESVKSATQTRQDRVDQTLDGDKTILITDCVFRIMTWDHIPVAPKAIRKTTKKKTAREIFEFDMIEEDTIDELELDLPDEANVNDMLHAKVNFPPFQHYKLTVNNIENHDQYQVKCVGKSHWRGDLVSGEFCSNHGQISKNLAKMYMVMCQKYSQKFNWRSYTYIDEMTSSAVLQLTYVGLRFNESKSSNPFAYFTQIITNSFCRILNTEKKSQNIRDDLLEMNGLNPSWSRNSSSNTHYEE